MIVTGASSGIGAALSAELHEAGAQLLLTARRADRLQALATQLGSQGKPVVWMPGDITCESVRAELLDVVQRQWGGLDVLINNAGVGARGTFITATQERLRRVMEVNFFAPVEFIRKMLPLLRRGRQPLIVNISSVLGHRAVPGKSEYCASKFALHGFSDALRAELKGDGVEVLLVSPSTTRSEFEQSVVEDTAGEDRSWRMGQMTSEQVARQTVRAIRQGRHEIILSPGGKLLVWLDRLSPPLVNRLVARFG